MKNVSKIAISAILLLSMLFSTACNLSGNDNEDGADDEQVEYTDLSDVNSPKYEDNEIYELTFDVTGSTDGEVPSDVDMRELCVIEAITEPSTSVGDALNKVAAAITNNFEAVGISAQIELRCVEYFQNSSVKNGAISYRAKVYLPDGETSSFKMITTDIKKLEGEWLELSDGYYGAKRDSLDQWKNTFDRSGIISLENNVIEFAEGVRSVEYAVIDADADHTDPAVKWHSPQHLVMNESGFDSLYINAALDYGSSLVKGEDYRFVIRGVSENDNYILHLDIPFTYSPISQTAIDELEAAKLALEGATVNCSPDTADKVAFITSELDKVVANENISVTLVCTADGMLSDIFNVRLSYSPDIISKRYPSYSLGGAQYSNFYDYTGDAYSISSFKVTYAEQSSGIKLVAPYDGERDLRIASDEVVRYYDTDVDVLKTNIYDYSKTEVCLPTPVKLEWTDTNKSNTYTVLVSENEDLSAPVTLTVTEPCAEINNLKAGQKYYWQVKSATETSAIFTFTTESGYPRFIKTENVSNFRDVGGYITLDGKTVKQGLLYRSANLDSVSDADIETITKFLGIKTDLDLRGIGEGAYAPLGDNAQFIQASIKYYSGIFETEIKETMRQALSALANEDNYPVCYHCAIGRDRTGTVTVIILGLLGVDEDTLLKEYLASLNSRLGNNDGASAPALEDNFKALINGFKPYGDRKATLQENIEAYLLDIGVTEAEIAEIRRIMLED